MWIENADGTYSAYEEPDIGEIPGTKPIKPFELKTFLKLGKCMANILNFYSVFGNFN